MGLEDSRVLEVDEGSMEVGLEVNVGPEDSTAVEVGLEVENGSMTMEVGLVVDEESTLVGLSTVLVLGRATMTPGSTKTSITSDHYIIHKPVY